MWSGGNRSLQRRAAAVCAALGIVATTGLVLAPGAPAGPDAPAAPTSGGTFGPHDAAWVALYSHPTDQGTWAAFCAGGHGTQRYNVLDVTPACGPVGTTQIYLPGARPAVGPPKGIGGPIGFTSLELVERYLYVKMGWPAVVGSGVRASRAVDLYAHAHRLVPTRNATHGQLPVAGDVISMWSTPGQTDHGETAVVTNVSMTDAMRGDGTMTWIAQDDAHSTAQARRVTISGWKIQTGMSGNYADWLNLRPSPVTITNFTDRSISGPYGIIAGPDGALWFTNYDGSSIGRITTSGAVSHYQAATISYPGDLTIGPDGALWFTNSSNGSIGRVTTRGTITTFHPSGAAGPWGIATGPDHELWFTNNWNSTIGRMTASGTTTEFHSNRISQPWEIVVGPDHAFWFTNSHDNSIGRITASGQVTSYTAPTVADPNDITVGPDGALWFTNLGNNSIGRITTAGVIGNFRSATISGPVSITKGPDGALWFTNSTNNSIGRITTTGTIANFTSPTVAGPYDITTGPDGALWFTNSDNSIGRITTPA